LSFEGERAQPFRILRAVKNRFGSTNEVGVFQMAEQGLLEVPDPSSAVSGRGRSQIRFCRGSSSRGKPMPARGSPGACGASSLAVPQRVARGVDRNRLAMIVAILARRARLPLLKCDIFVNVAGGLAVEDPAADLAVALAVVSAWRDGSQGQGAAAFGELSLTATYGMRFRVTSASRSWPGADSRGSSCPVATLRRSRGQASDSRV